MIIVNDINEMSELSNKWRQEGKSIGLVPTMGYLQPFFIYLLLAKKDNINIQLPGTPAGSPLSAGSVLNALGIGQQLMGRKGGIYSYCNIKIIFLTSNPPGLSNIQRGYCPELNGRMLR